MFDVHCHILPGLDDGAENWAESIEMARIAAADGISGVVCTPHQSPDFPENLRYKVIASVETLRTKLREAAIGLQLYPGCELAIDPNLPAKIESGESLTINDNRKIALVEMPADTIPPDLAGFFRTLQTKGINIILAHPERNPLLIKHPAELLKWVQAGIMVQITAGSLNGYYGDEILDFSLELLQHRMVHFVASDSHSRDMRRPVLSMARTITEEIIGPGETRKIFCEYPVSVLRGDVPDTPPPIPIEKKTPLIRRFFRFS